MSDRNKRRTQTISLTEAERKQVLQEAALGISTPEGASAAIGPDDGELEVLQEEIPVRTPADAPSDEGLPEELPGREDTGGEDAPDAAGPSEDRGPSEETGRGDGIPEDISKPAGDESSEAAQEEPAEPGEEEEAETADEGPSEEKGEAEEPASSHGSARSGESASGHAVTARKRSRKHRKKNWFLRLLLAAAIIAAFIVVARMPYFEVTHTPVIGNKTITDAKILNLSGLQEGQSIFFVNPWLVSSRIKENLYIEDVKVDRKLPRTVEIIVKERPPAAQMVRFTKKGKIRYVVIDKDGMVMGKPKKRKKITVIDNVTVVKAEKGSTIKVAEDDMGVFRKSMDMIKAAQQGDLYFMRIRIRGSMTRAYIYDHLVCKGRYRNVMDSIANGTLRSVVYRLYQEDVTKGTINIGDNNYCSFTPQN